MPESSALAARAPRRLARRVATTDARATHLMRETLEQGLTRSRGHPVRIREMRREFLPSSSSFRTERLRVALDGGETLRVFFKDLNPRHQLEKARAVRQGELAPSRRELDVYRSILSRHRFGTLQLHAFRWEPERGVYWIFLEDGGRALLRNTVDPAAWLAAARWAARFHAATRDLPDARTRFLPAHDRAFHERCAARVERILPDLGPRERELVERGLVAYRGSIARLGALPRCVLHGQFFGQNIMLRGGASAPEIVVIDWETAALGPGLFDLASLTSGRWTTSRRQAMWRAYVREYETATDEAVDWTMFRRDLACVALHLSLEWLAWWARHRRLSRDFAKFLRDLRRVLAERAALA